MTGDYCSELSFGLAAILELGLLWDRAVAKLLAWVWRYAGCGVIVMQRLTGYHRSEAMQVQLILCAFQKLTAFKTKMMVKRIPMTNARIRAACRPS